MEAVHSTGFIGHLLCIQHCSRCHREQEKCKTASALKELTKLEAGVWETQAESDIHRVQLQDNVAERPETTSGWAQSLTTGQE